MSNKQQRKMPTERQIREYWAEWLSSENSDKFDSPQEAREKGVCFACGMKAMGNIERAHITARCEGGTDTLDNLHMLCKACHKDSEFLSGDAYFQWFRERTAFDMFASVIMRSGGVDAWKAIQDAAQATQPEARP